MAQRASHTGAGLEQLLAAPHISIMIRTNSFLSKYYKTAGFHLHTPDDLIIHCFISPFLSVPS